MTSTLRSAALVAVIGPAAHDLVAAFVAHYSGLGVTDTGSRSTSHPGRTAADRDRLISACGRAGAPPDLVSEGPWRVETNPRLRDELRDRAVADWHVLADADELQFHPGGVRVTIEGCVNSSVPFSTGLLVDRLRGAERPLPSATTPADLDGAFPVGSFLTAQLLDGDPRKVTIAHRDVRVDSPGNHFTTSRPPAEHPAPMPVHHFKWRSGAHDLAGTNATVRGSAEPAEIGVRREAVRAVERPSRAAAQAGMTGSRCSRHLWTSSRSDGVSYPPRSGATGRWSGGENAPPGALRPIRIAGSSPGGHDGGQRVVCAPRSPPGAGRCSDGPARPCHGLRAHARRAGQPSRQTST